jgi:hypothetical protein
MANKRRLVFVIIAAGRCSSRDWTKDYHVEVVHVPKGDAKSREAVEEEWRRHKCEEHQPERQLGGRTL